MEDLNKNQIILLTLFVSFVTSIATGIVTVTLLDQAPQGVTRTINRVVERTVERVVPDERGVSTVVKEVPVIVTEEELIVKAINTASPAIFRLAKKTSRDEIEILGSAAYVRTGGYFVTESTLANDFREEDYLVVNEAGQEFPVVEVARGSKSLLIKVDEQGLPDFNLAHASEKPLSLSSEDFNVGQTVIGVGATSAGSHTVSVSIISSLSGLNSATTTLITTNAATAEDIGGPLLAIGGEAIGINVAPGMAVSIREVIGLLDSVE